MKKLIFVFVALFMLPLISGCGARQNTIRYDKSDESGDETDTIEEVSEEVSEEASEEAVAEDIIIDEIDEVKAISAPTGKLAVTSFDGGFLKTNLSYNVIKGNTPSNTHRITINDYKLTKYISGQTQWDYIASSRFGTLKNGLNTYVLKTYDVDDKQTDSIIFSIDYTAPTIPETLPNVGTSHWLAIILSLMISTSYIIFRKLKWL